MRLFDVYENASKISKKLKPTFVGLKFSKESNNVIYELSRGLPNRINEKSIHVTLIYSREPIKYTSKNPKKPITATPKCYSIFSGTNDTKCLVIELDSPEIISLHNSIMDSTGASYDFPEYKPHVTLSYNVGNDFDLDTLPAISDIPELYLDVEYTQDIDFSWGLNNVVKD